MRELEQHTKVEIHQETNKQQIKEQKFLGRLNPKRGHTLWKINIVSMDIEKAIFDTDTIVLDSLDGAENQLKKRKLIVEDGYFYISALNKKNAIKKYIENGK
jgi:hypothetical protein